VVEPLANHSRISELAGLMSDRILTKRILDLETGTVELANGCAEEQLCLSNGRLLTIHGPRLRLLIIGAGQLSQFLAQIALCLEYQVTVCDPRDEHRASWTLKGVELVALCQTTLYCR